MWYTLALRLHELGRPITRSLRSGPDRGHLLTNPHECMLSAFSSEAGLSQRLLRFGFLGGGHRVSIALRRAAATSRSRPSEGIPSQFWPPTVDNLVRSTSWGSTGAAWSPVPLAGRTATATTTAHSAEAKARCTSARVAGAPSDASNAPMMTCTASRTNPLKA